MTRIPVVAARLLVWDTRLLSRLVMRHEQRWRLRIARAFTRSADGGGYAVIPPLLLFGFGKSVMPLLAAGAAAAIVERFVYARLKSRLRRPRPFRRFASIPAHVDPPDQFSFPSGHTSAAALVAVLLSAQVPALLPLLVLWVAGVGGSRVCLGMHYPSDVVAGALIGSGLASLALPLADLAGFPLAP